MMIFGLVGKQNKTYQQIFDINIYDKLILFNQSRLY